MPTLLVCQNHPKTQGKARACPNFLAVLKVGEESTWPDSLPLATSVQRIQGCDGCGSVAVPAAAVAFESFYVQLARPDFAASRRNSARSEQAALL